MSKYRIILDGKTYEMEVVRIDGVGSHNSTPLEKKPIVNSEDNAMTVNQSINDRIVFSPMPGTIVDIKVKEGDAVKKGQTIIVLEAMKMENDIGAPRDGKIKKIFVNTGNTVQGGTKLFEIDE